MTYARAVMMHAYTENADGSTYCEPADPGKSGWCVYVRQEPGGDTFDTPEEQDFEAHPDALAHAETLATILSLEFVQY
jgi:hypothetical protein